MGLQRYDFIAQARGVGLMIGIEFWDGAKTKRHASAVTKWVQQQMIKRRILLSVDGPFNSVIKIKPPIVMDENEVSMLSAELDLVCPLHAKQIIKSLPRVALSSENLFWTSAIVRG